VIILIDDKATTEENPQRLTFDKFLSNSKKIDHLTIFSRDELHER